MHPTAGPTYFADLNRCVPQSHLNRQGKRTCWRLLDYETDAFKGVMLFAGEETEAKAVTYPLALKGWHEIYVGMFNTAWRPYEDQRLWAKLKDDAAFSLLYLPKPSKLPWGVPLDDQLKGPRIQEIFWKTADLTGQTVTFQQPCRQMVPAGQHFGNSCQEVWVAYIKVVRLSPPEVSALEEDRNRSDTKRLFGYNDAWSTPHFDRAPIMPGESLASSIVAQLEPYRHSDFCRIYWEGAHGDVCHYFTRIGRMWTREHIDVETLPRIGDRLVVESWNDYLESNIDPFRVAVDFSREIGLEFHACYRLGWGAFYWPPPFEGYNKGGFFEKHPELRCVRRDGTKSPALSYAFPETRRMVLDLLIEMADYGVDGVCILYTRQPPFLEYEPPLVEAFKSRYGQDPRNLDEKDARWLAFRCEVLTQFMRDLKRELASLADRQKRLKPIPTTAWVFGHEDENLFYGLDLRTWVKEGLVQTLIPYTSARKSFSWEFAWENLEDVNYWLALTRGSQCQLALNVMPRDMDARQYRHKAHSLYQAGVTHLAFWDTPIVGAPSSEALRRLGHKHEIADWINAGEPTTERPAVPLRKLEQWDLNHLPE